MNLDILDEEFDPAAWDAKVTAASFGDDFYEDYEAASKDGAELQLEGAEEAVGAVLRGGVFGGGNSATATNDVDEKEPELDVALDRRQAAKRARSSTLAGVDSTGLDELYGKLGSEKSVVGRPY
eukprot:COSAG01_NODE_6095_length_3853_cov_3.213372_2_plen_124_part_00